MEEERWKMQHNAQNSLNLSQGHFTNIPRAAYISLLAYITPHTLSISDINQTGQTLRKRGINSQGSQS